MMSMAPGSTVKQVSDETMTRCRPRLHEPLVANAMGVGGLEHLGKMQSPWEIATDCWILVVMVVLTNSIGLYSTC